MNAWTWSYIWVAESEDWSHDQLPGQYSPAILCLHLGICLGKFGIGLRKKIWLLQYAEQQSRILSKLRKYSNTWLQKIACQFVGLQCCKQHLEFQERADFTENNCELFCRTDFKVVSSLQTKLKVRYSTGPKILSCLAQIHNWVIASEETDSIPKF